MTHTKDFLMVTVDGGGNLPPMFGLARQLAARGHRVRVLTEPCLRDVVEGQGLTHVPFTEYFTRTDRSVDIFNDSKTSLTSNPSMDNVILGPAKTVVEQTLEEIRRQPTDAVLVDVLLPPALIAAEAAGIPGVSVFHMPEYLPGANRPPGMLGLLPGKGPLGRVRDRLLGRVFQLLLKKYQPLINSVREQHGLEPLRSATDLFHNADLRLIQTARAFDFPLDPAPANVRYTGPVLDDPDWVQAWHSPWAADDPRPLVVVSLSSTFQDQREVIQRAIDALGGFPVRGLVTVGPAMDPAGFTAADNVAVVASAPHSIVFPRASVVITHAGHGTIMRAFASGVPLVCLPMGRDQNDNAAKIEFHGCGLKLKPKADAGVIRAAVNRLLVDESFATAARRLGREVAAAAKSDVAANEIEKLLGVQRTGAQVAHR